MNAGIRVGAVIVNWNSGGDLARCLAALSAQTLPPCRTVVVDNASTDGSASGIEERFPETEVIRLDSNTGFAAAVNRGMHRLEGMDWVALLNPDAFARPNWLACLKEAAEQHPDFVFLGSHMLRHGETGVLDGTGDVYHVSGLGWRRDHGIEADRVRRQTGEIFAPCAAAALVKRQAFLEVGGFDERYHSYFEDVDLAFRLRLRGGRCLYVAGAVVEHVGSGSTHRYSDYAIYHGHRNLVWTYVKNMPRDLFWVTLPQHLLANLAALVWFSLQGQARVIFRAKWDALKGLPAALKQRQTIQRRVRVKPRDLRRVMARGLWLPYSKSKRTGKLG